MLMHPMNASPKARVGLSCTYFYSALSKTPGISIRIENNLVIAVTTRSSMQDKHVINKKLANTHTLNNAYFTIISADNFASLKMTVLLHQQLFLHLGILQHFYESILAVFLLHITHSMHVSRLPFSVHPVSNSLLVSEC